MYSEEQLENNRSAWTAALRSGLFRQTTGHLEGCGGHCCLGVACVVYEEQTGVKLERDASYSIAGGALGHSDELRKVQEWLGLTTTNGDLDDGSALTELNDGGTLDFKDIADLIESNPKGLFRKQETTHV